MSVRRKAKAQRPKTQPRRVDFKYNDEDFEVAFGASIGLYTRAIVRDTQCTESQVQYRLKIAKRYGLPTRREYREGTSPFVEKVRRAARATLDADIHKMLDQQSPRKDES